MDNKTSAVPLLLAAIVIALIAGVSGWALRSRTGTPIAAERPAIATPESRTESVHTIPQSRAPLVPAMDMPGPDPLADMKARDEEASKLVDAGKQKLLRRYEGERVDTAWARRKQQTLERLSISPQIEQVNAQPLSFNAQCRQSVCLISAEFPSRLAADDWFTLYTLNTGGEMFSASSDRTMNPDGSARLQIYGLARQ